MPKNKLMFNNSLMKNSYKHSIGNNTMSFGNLTYNLHSDNVPVIMINLSANFNIPANKMNINNKIINNIIKQSNILPYVTYIYKNSITKKCSIMDSEYSYNNIKNTADELVYLLHNYYGTYDHILCVYLGRYAEYQYLNNMIHNYSNSISTKVHNIFNRHPSQFINDKDPFKNKILLDDIDRIVRKINQIKKFDKS